MPSRPGAAERAALIVFVDHDTSGPSGITTYGSHLAAHLPDLHRIHLQATGDTSEAASRERVLAVPPERSHDPDQLADALVAFVRRHPGRRVVWLPNVSDVSWAATWRGVERLSPRERAALRIYGIVHGDQDSQYAAMARYAPIIAGVAAVSRQCVERLRARVPADLHVDALHYPVHLPPARSVESGDRVLRLLYAGRFEESQKRVSRLPTLFRQLGEAGIPFTASLAGDGPARQALERGIAELPDAIRQGIAFQGALRPSAMSDLLCAHDVLLLVSAFEGTPLVLLEAMASGVCPVLMELPGGLPELLIDGQNGCIVPQDDLPGMVDAIRRLHHDRVHLDAMKAAARHAIERRADPAVHASALQRRLDALWDVPPPEPARVTEPDPLGARIDALVRQVLACRPARIGIWGAGVVGRRTVDRLLGAGLTPVMIVDNDPRRHGAYRDIAVRAPDALAPASPDLVCVGSVAFSTEIVRALHSWPSPPRVLAP